jgi:Fe-S oxidoreductase
MQAAVDVAKPKNPVETTEECRYCWMCRQACPVGHVTARETLTPHGWALTIASVRRGTIAWTDEAVDVLYACADCGLCRAHCITDRPLPDAIVATRAEIVRSGKAPAIVKELNERLRRSGTLYSGRATAAAASDVAAAPSPESRPGLEEEADFAARGGVGGAAGGVGDGRSGGASGAAGGVGEGRGGGASGAAGSVGEGRSGGASGVAGGVGEGRGGAHGSALGDELRGVEVVAGAVAGARGVGDGAAGVGLFVSDSVRQLGARELEAALRLLGAVGITPVLVAEGRSNGVVASSLGLVDTASALARAVVSDVDASGCRELLVLTPEDRFAFEGVYRDRLGISWPASVAIREVTSVLAEALAARRLTFRAPETDLGVGSGSGSGAAYAYHDPCHAARVERDDAAARALLAAALGAKASRDLFWRERRAHPCGATGGLQFTQPAIAAKLADARIADARAAGASWLITDDPGCAHHLRTRPQGDVTILGFYQVLADRLLQ